MRSMTAYAESIKRNKDYTIRIALRSVNSRYLDILIYGLPQEDVCLEWRIKQLIAKKIKRGRIEVFMKIFPQKYQKMRINIPAIKRYLSQMKNLSQQLKISSDISLRELLTLPEAIQTELSSIPVNRNLLLSAINDTLSKALLFKIKEGENIKRDIVKNITILRKNLKSIIKLKPKISEGEITKEDIDEEVALIGFYLNRLYELAMAKTSVAKGKKMDFVTQEILRELNTASAKSKDVKLAGVLLESKNVLEKIREQIQNIE